MNSEAEYAERQRLIAALGDPHCYPHSVARVRLIETHISWVLLAGRYAYKIKKPVNLEFLDFSTLAQRKHFCEEEVRLNRRLAPGLYLGTVPVGGDFDHPKIDSQPVIEYAVKMRRFSARCLMDRQLARGGITTKHIDTLAATLAQFHAALPAADDPLLGGFGAVRTAVMQNFEQLQAYAGVAELKVATEAELAACAPVFERRRVAGCVRECHGDLHLGNIALIDNVPVPFDGIEFNPALRWIDVMDEIAFPVMDLMHRGRADFAWRLLNGYLEITGDYGGMAVLRLYLAYRATVRAKVDIIRANQSGLPARAKNILRRAGQSYLDFALGCFAKPQPALIITHGLPGSGKSTFAQAALEHLGAIRIRSDVERKRLFGLGALDDSRQVLGTGVLYTSEATVHTYARLAELAARLLANGCRVIVDAAFLRRDEREIFRQLAARMHLTFIIANMTADMGVLRERVRLRQERGQDASEADVAVLEKLAQSRDPLGPEEQVMVLEYTDNAGFWPALERRLAEAVPR